MKPLFVLADGREIRAAGYKGYMSSYPDTPAMIELYWDAENADDQAVIMRGDCVVLNLDGMRLDCKVLSASSYGRVCKYPPIQEWVLLEVE